MVKGKDGADYVEIPAVPRHPHYKADTRQGVAVEYLTEPKQHNEKEQATCLLSASNRIRIEKSSGHKWNPLWPLDLVEVTGFEPATSASRTQRSTKLSHIPKYCNALYYTRKKNICQEDYMKILTLPAENGF